MRLRTLPPILLAVPLLCAAVARSEPVIDRTRLVEAMALERGQWSSTVTIESIALDPLPGRAPIPDERLAAAQALIGHRTGVGDCLTAAAPLADDLLIPAVRVAASCPVDILEAAAGRLRYRVRCGDGQGFSSQTNGEGIYTPTTINARLRVSATSAGAGVAILTTVRVVSRHVGRCVSGSPRPERRGGPGS